MKALSVTLLLSSFLFTACSNMTDDPRQGGLFSYSPSKYEKRLQQREAELAAAEAEQSVENSRRSSLESQKAQKQKEVSQLRSQLKKEQSRVDRSLKNVKNKNDPEYLALKKKNEPPTWRSPSVRY